MVAFSVIFANKLIYSIFFMLTRLHRLNIYITVYINRLRTCRTRIHTNNTYMNVQLIGIWRRGTYETIAHLVYVYKHCIGMYFYNGITCVTNEDERQMMTQISFLDAIRTRRFPPFLSRAHKTLTIDQIAFIQEYNLLLSKMPSP